MNGRRSATGAFVVAAPAALGAWIAAYFMWALFTEGPVRAALQVPYLLMGAILFGAPVVLALLLLVALPVFAVTRGLFRVTLPLALVTGAACGLVGRESVIRMWGMPESNFVPVPVVVLAGIAAATIWWVSWNREGGSPRGRGTI